MMARAMRHAVVLFALPMVLPLLFSCGGRSAPEGAASSDSELDAVAEAYVKLALAVGRHDVNYVDAYYGPPEWQREANEGEPRPVSELLARGRELLGRVRSAPASDRREFLEKQLAAAEGFLRRVSGERMSLTEEARVLYDVEPPAHTVAEFEPARRAIEALLPGPGLLEERVTAFRRRFFAPKEKLADVVRSCLQIARERTVARMPLPQGETFRVSFVQQKPWSAYNWYQGDLSSRIEINTDLPAELPGLFRTVSHEGYPGHHTYNVLLEDRLVRGKGWKEFTVGPLYAPHALLSEGLAEVGPSVILTDAEMLEVLRSRLAPIAGLEKEDFARYAELVRALEPLKYVRGEAARMLLDEGKGDDEVAAFIERYGLETPERARKALDFARTYRAYVFNYTAGEDLVRAYIGEGADRAERFFGVLQRPATPSALAAEVRGRR